MRRFEKLVEEVLPNSKELVTETALGRFAGNVFHKTQMAGNALPYIFHGNQRGSSETKGMYDTRMLLQNGKTDAWKTYHAGYTPVLINYSERYSKLKEDVQGWVFNNTHKTEAKNYPAHCVTLFDSGIDYGKVWNDQHVFLDNLIPNVKKPNSNGRNSYYAQYRFSGNQRGIDPIGAMVVFGGWVETADFGRSNNAYALMFTAQSDVNISQEVYKSDKNLYMKNVCNILKANETINYFLDAMKRAEMQQTPSGSPTGSGLSATPTGGSPLVNPINSSYFYNDGRSLVQEDDNIPPPIGLVQTNNPSSPDSENIESGQDQSFDEKTLFDRMNEVINDGSYSNDYGKKYLSRLISMRINDNEFSLIKEKLENLIPKLDNPDSLTLSDENDLCDTCGIIAFPRESMDRESFMSSLFRVIIPTCGLAVGNAGISDDFIFVPKEIADKLDQSTSVIKTGMLSAVVQNYIGRYLGKTFKSTVDSMMKTLTTSKVDRVGNVINNVY